jgi:WD40 repeat protein
LGPSGAYGFKAIEFSPIDESVYVTTNSGGFYQIDTFSGQANKIADTGHLSLNNLAFAPNGNLFAVDSASDELVKVDLQTGNVTFIGSLSPYGDVTAFAIDNSGKGVGWDSGAEWLFEIDLVDGSITSLGHLPGSFDAFDYSPDDVLYGWDYLDGADGGRLYGIDVANVGLDSYLGQFYPGSMWSFTLTPEPSTLLLFALGAVMLRRKR